MIPAIVATLLQQGLGLLGNAVLAKGKDVIEKQLGVNIEEATQSPDGLLKLKQLEFSHEEFLIEAAQKKAELELAGEVAAGAQVTERWKADMGSDSYLSKNIRPMVLIFILAVYTVFGLMSAFDLEVNQAYVELLGQWGMLIMSAYFVGRTVEKGVNMATNRRKS